MQGIRLRRSMGEGGEDAGKQTTGGRGEADRRYASKLPGGERWRETFLLERLDGLFKVAAQGWLRALAIEDRDVGWRRARRRFGRRD